MQAVYFLIRPGPGALIKPLKQAGKRKQWERSRGSPSLPFFPLFLRLIPHARNISYTHVRGAAAVLGFLINEHPVNAKRITVRRRSPSCIITPLIIIIIINDGIIRSIKITVVIITVIGIIIVSIIR